MSEKNPIRVFVSHLFSEGDDYLRVFEFLESDDRFYYLNVSKPENAPADGRTESIKDELIAQIKASEIVVILPGAFAEKPDLVNYMMGLTLLQAPQLKSTEWLFQNQVLLSFL